jgi:hypothetical protein
MITDTQLMEAVMAVCPNATLGQDNEGQLVIYTNKKYNESNYAIVEMEEGE